MAIIAGIEIEKEKALLASLQKAIMLTYLASAETFVRTSINKKSHLRVAHFVEEWKRTPIDETTSRFINLEQSFLQQWKKHSEYFPGLSEYTVRERMKISAELLLQCYPDVITIQVTGEGSLFYTVRKNSISIYLQHYLIDEYDDTDEAIVTLYKGDKKLLEYGGSLSETIHELSLTLASESINLPEFA